MNKEALINLLGKALTVPLKALSWTFETVPGTATMGGVNGISNLLEATAPVKALKGPRMSEAGIKEIESLKTADRRSKMAPKNLKELLIQKIASKSASKNAGTEKCARANLPFSVTDADIDFVSKLASAPIEKTAAPGYLTKLMEPLIPTLEAGALMYMGGNMAGAAYDRVSDYIKRDNAYTQMFNEFPQLNEVPREQVDKYWNVLNDYAPKMTINPLVAGQFIENMLNYGVKGIDHNTVSQLMQAESHGRNASGSSDLSKMFGGLGSKAWEQGANAMSGDPDFSSLPLIGQ